MDSLCVIALLLTACSSVWAQPIENIAYDELSSYLEGDILPSGKMRMALADNHRLWPGGNMPYKIAFSDEDHFYANSILLSAITRINDVKCVNLVKAGSGAVDYVTFEIGQNFSSHLGRQGGAQSLTITDNANWGSVMHEIMHTLGFGHEHNRPDRDEYVTVYFDNIKEGAKRYFKKYTADDDHAADETAYDFTSLMHATSQRKEDVNIDMTKPVIERKDGTPGLGQRDHLTEGDKERMRLVYSCGMCQNAQNESRLFRYPGDCTMYYQCAQGHPVPMHCPSNLHFNVKTNACDYSWEANCTSQ